MPVAIETKENGMPEDVQVDEPEDMGAMSAEEAGDIVGCRRKTLNIIMVNLKHHHSHHHLC